MAYLKFNKAELVNLEYSLKREMLATNRAGGYLNTTIVGCNTRKYHGLFAVPVENFGGHRYMLISAIDETLLQQGKPFNLGIHCYGDIFEPRGHKYIVDFEMDPIPTVTFSVGGMLFKKELVFVGKTEQLLIRYTLLEDSGCETILRLKPFLSFRSIHALTKANIDADTRYRSVEGGVGYRLYRDFPELVLQFSTPFEYVHCPDWYKDIVYREEFRRGFDCTEDQLVPGFFEAPIRKGQSVVLSISTQEVDISRLPENFEYQVAKIEPRNDFDSCLKAAASQLIAYSDNGLTRICTGFSWHEIGGLRETCISLPGLTIYNTGDVALFEKILDDLIHEKENAIFKSGTQVESPLRLVELVQHLASFTGRQKEVWKKYGDILKRIVESYISGRPEVVLHRNGLLWARLDGVALSWMNAYVGGKPVTERSGYQVETNCFWYNALRYVSEMEETFGQDKTFAGQCKEIADNIERCFYDMFWVEKRRHLADYVDENGQNVFTRPNQLYACSLQYSPVSEAVQAEILHAVKGELLTTRGIRTLSPKNPLYRSRYDGDQVMRDLATHNGCNRPWLLGAFVQAAFKLFGSSFTKYARELVEAFQEDMNIHGIGAVAEIYDGDPPYIPHGAINSALSVAELLRVKYMIDNSGEEKK